MWDDKKNERTQGLYEIPILIATPYSPNSTSLSHLHFVLLLASCFSLLSSLDSQLFLTMDWSGYHQDSLLENSLIPHWLRLWVADKICW